jgi:hypothetical protein
VHADGKSSNGQQEASTTQAQLSIQQLQDEIQTLLVRIIALQSQATSTASN